MDIQQHQQQIAWVDGSSSSSSRDNKWRFKGYRISWILLVVFVSIFRGMRSSISDLAAITTAYTQSIQQLEAVVQSSYSTSSIQQHQTTLESGTGLDKSENAVEYVKQGLFPDDHDKTQHDELSPREIVKTKPFHKKTVAYITFGSFQQGPTRFHTMIIDSLRTWLEDDVIFYVLNKEWKTKFEEACQEPDIHKECNRIIPIFVDCPEGYYGASPCCKMDKGMSIMWQNYSHYDWYSYQDDDMYIRTAYLDDFLSGLSPEDPMVLTCKGTRQLGVSWGETKHNSNCSTDLDYMYPWGQPAMYSRAGLERMSKAFQLDGIAKQCKTFGVTHDAGNPIVHWMVGLPEVRLPNIPPHPPKSWNGMLLGAHGVGKPNVPNITEIHAQIGHVKHPQPPYKYQWHKPNGFLQTITHKLYGNVSDWSEWHTMNVSECHGPPIVEKKMPLRNKTVAYITFGSFNKGPERFHTMIIDSLRTWLDGDDIFYVLNTEWKPRFEEACQDPTIHEECKRIIPIFVNCPEAYYGASPCCKMDKGMSVMWANYSHYDWYSYQDDDMYIRTSYLNDFLSGLSPEEPMVLTCKGTRPLGVSWGEAKHKSNCSSDLDFMYPWGQPAMYSRAGLELMSKAFQLDGIAKQCASFGVTHDAGNPIVHWMMGLPEVRLPNIPPHPPATLTHGSTALLGAHGVGKPNAINITEFHAQIGHLKYPPPPYVYKWHRPNGFLQTTTYKSHGNVSEWNEWHMMNVSDCRGPVHLEAN